MKAKQVSKEKKSILIIANGEPTEDKYLQTLADQSDIIIAADGGSNICFQTNIYPDFIIGDLDSIQQHVLIHFKECEIIRVADQSTHDLAKAIDLTKTLNPGIIRVVAAFGKRLDHSIANLLLIQKTYRELPLEFHDLHGRLSMISESYILDAPVGQIVSLFSFLPVKGLSLSGFKYSLENKDYPDGFNGLSNVVDQQDARIHIENGSLFLFITYDNIKS
jgi:thiamine pyrophosphokinase